jgi:hypothetical protein
MDLSLMTSSSAAIEGVFLFFLFARNQFEQLPGLFDSQNGHFGMIKKSYLR